MIGMKTTEARYYPYHTVSWAHTPNKVLSADEAFDCLDEAMSVRFSTMVFLFSSPYLYPMLFGRKLL
jgi:hypothetical protein